jgi:hypothetical protein
VNGKREVPRKEKSREVELAVDGKKVSINGYVMDVFEEVVVGLVRALGEENPDGEIRVTVAPRG